MSDAGPTGLAGQAFSLCFRVYLPDVGGHKLLRDDRMHDLLLWFLRGRPDS